MELSSESRANSLVELIPTAATVCPAPCSGPPDEGRLDVSQAVIGQIRKWNRGALQKHDAIDIRYPV